MLDNLERVDWAKLKHAYGPAKDVPKFIRMLQSPDAKVRKDAIWNLYGNIFHQGTRYEATPHAVPFLVELASDPSTQERHELIMLLVSLAIGYQENFLPSGLNAERFRAELRGYETSMTSEERKECQQFGLSPLADLATYDAVKDAVPLFISLLDAADDDLVCASAFALAWFPEAADRSLPALTRLIAETGSASALANALLAAGLLTHNSGARFDEQMLQKPLKDPKITVRAAAALTAFAMGLRGKPFELLLNALNLRKEIKAEGLIILFNDGDLVGWIARALAQAPASATSEVAAGLMNALRSTNAYQALDVTGVLLALVTLGARKRAAHFKGRKFEELSKLEQEILRAIRDHGGWTVGGDSLFANFSNVVEAHGLPSTPEEFRKYVAD